MTTVHGQSLALDTNELLGSSQNCEMMALEDDVSHNWGTLGAAYCPSVIWRKQGSLFVGRIRAEQAGDGIT